MQRFEGFLLEGQGQNRALTVLSCMCHAGVSRFKETALPEDPTVGICLRRGAVSYERGTPVFARQQKVHQTLESA